ncbi:rhamnan synthesis F family protein [Wenzhouxiangella limi]|uniref:Rhamnan synthesis protein F n=1 Tax=Wenzhouxiangella limi TaxID=2707351 RepID=A0A845UWR0_9GAMM|nr:rhamnan synthesis F family protein [Wenzhouxiangella limi]NDY96293.1 hypothetical protein [Wenzhouxiangella limi]
MKTRLANYVRHKAWVFSLLRRLLVFSPTQRAYLNQLKQSGLFDRAFYRRQNPQLMPLFLWLPERHYIAFGEAAGLFPRPDFSPTAYLRLNPEAAASQLPPFLHYLKAGCDQQLITRDPSPTDKNKPAPLPPVRSREPGSDLAAVVHVYYPDLWPEIEQLLADSGLAMDWYITITDLGPTHRELAEAISRSYPLATVLLMPNHGRDVFPWVYLINAGVLDPYRAVCKLHTKRSPHLEHGAAWRDSLLRGVLPGAASATRVKAFLEHPKLGLLVCQGQHLQGPKWWGANQPRAMQMLARAGLQPDPQALNFAAGSIFWVKAPIIQAIAALGLTAADFEPEQGGTDGSTAHAFERALGYLVTHCGLRVGEQV